MCVCVNDSPVLQQMMGTKRGTVRIQVDADEGGEGKKQEETFYTRVYDDAVAKRQPLDNTIIE